MSKTLKYPEFKSKEGKLINADLNGLLNILKKAVGEFEYTIEVCSTPIRVNIISSYKS